MHVVITAEAETDLEDIFDYIAQDSPRLAGEFVRKLREKATNWNSAAFLSAATSLWQGNSNCVP
jgi:plasmid stabilization system protein ParE